MNIRTTLLVTLLAANFAICEAMPPLQWDLMAKMSASADEELQEPVTLFDLEDPEEKRLRILGLEDNLNKGVFGQPHAARTTANAIVRYFAGVSDPEQPIANFLYLGPTGVGKTELAKVLAEHLTGTRHKMLRMDMSEYSVGETVWRIIGSPPGYANHQSGGMLTNYVRRNPQSIILLDEIEKAHSDVHKLFLGVLDEGRIKDNRDRWIDFTQCVFIMTSNISAQTILELDRSGYDPDEILKEIQSNLIYQLSPELFNRLEPVIFKGLQPGVMEDLTHKFLDRVAANLWGNCEIELTFTELVVDYLIENGFSANLGARPLKRLIDREIISAVAYAIVEHSYRALDRLELDYVDGVFEVNYLGQQPVVDDHDEL